MRKAAGRIVEKLRLHGHEAFFAGGWVRDFLLRRKPKDIDIATSARPEQVQEMFPGARPVGARYGVVQVRLYGHPYEVVTFRSEGPYLDGRHPSTVTFTGPEADARRRDFTINGLFYDPAAEKVIDFIRGRADLKHRIVRTIGNPEERFAEDHLRMLRAVRFACALEFDIHRATADAIRRHGAAILKVSGERIRDELLKILADPARTRGLDLLHETGLLKHILPEVEAMRGVAQPPEFHPEGDVYTHTRLALGLLRKPSPILALGTLLHDVGKPPTFAVKERIRFDGHVELGAEMAENICRRLRMSNEEITGVKDLVLHHLRFMHAHEMRPSTLRRFISLPRFEDHLEMHRADCLAGHRSLDSYHLCRRKFEEMKKEPEPPAPLITGDDLIALGYQPGPLFGKILEEVEDLRLDGAIATREEALTHVKDRFAVQRGGGQAQGGNDGTV